MCDPDDIRLYMLSDWQRDCHLAFRKIEQEYSFFYDETNNIRKFYLKSNKFNSPTDDNFVLGGIFYNTNRNSINFENLFSSLRLHKNIIDVKFRHICNGDFTGMLDSVRLNIILNWILSNNIYIHFENLDMFYWGIVDIVDSVERLDHLHNLELKDNLYHVIRNDRSTFLSLCDKYCYPNIKREELVDYKNEMYSFFNKNKHIIQPIFLELFDGFIDAFMASEYFDFIMDEEDRILINNFSHFYVDQLTKFKNAKHILDEEKTISEIIAPLAQSDLKDVDFKFVDSQSLREIQLSDIIVGFLGRYFTYIKNTSLEDLEKVKENLSGSQKNNLRLFIELIIKSEQLTPLSTSSITSFYDLEKSRRFLQDL